MEFVKEFINTYGVTILYALLTAIAGFVGIYAKKLAEKYINDKTKQAVAKTCVQAIEQLYKDLHGEEKYQKCAESISEMLHQKGIEITDLELKMLVEAAVSEFNKAFEDTQSQGYIEVEQSPDQTTYADQMTIDDAFEQSADTKNTETSIHI